MFVIVLLSAANVFSRVYRDPARKEPLTSVENGELLCTHAGLLYRPSPDFESESK